MELFIVKNNYNKMMSFFKSLILSIGISVMVFGCGGSKHSTNTVYGERMMNSYVMENVTQRQVDSICVADTLPNFNEWVGSIYVDFETRQTVVKRIYMKSKEPKQILYVIIGEEEPYKVERRITE